MQCITRQSTWIADRACSEMEVASPPPGYPVSSIVTEPALRWLHQKTMASLNTLALCQLSSVINKTLLHSISGIPISPCSRTHTNLIKTSAGRCVTTKSKGAGLFLVTAPYDHQMTMLGDQTEGRVFFVPV